jgi:phage I-like protein
MSTQPDAAKLTLACFGISNGALAAEKLPDVLTLLKWGENETKNGKLIVNQFTADSIAQQIASGTHDHVLIDFEHQSEKGHPNFCPPPRHHAGRGFVFCDAQRGLGIERNQWSPAGIAFAKDYPDVSPALVHDKATGVVHFLSSVALVPQGGVVGLSFYDAVLSITPDQQPIAEMRKMLDDLFARIAALEASLAKPATYDAGKILALPELAGLVAGLTAHGKSIEQLSAEITRRDKDAILERAAYDGKLVCLDAGAVAALSVQQLRDHVAKLQATVPVRPRTPGAMPLDQSGLSIIEQYNAIKDPAARAAFYDAHRSEIVGKR